MDLSAIVKAYDIRGVVGDGLDEPVPSTIESVEVLEALRPILRKEKTG